MKIQLNLLPPAQKSVLRTQRIFRQLLNQQLFFVIVGVVTIVTLATMNAVIGTARASLEEVNASSLSTEGYQEVQKLQTVFREVNKKVGVIDNISKAQIEWIGIVRLLSEDVPREIDVDRIETNDNKVTIAGTADTVSDIVKYRADLSTRALSINGSEVECFQNVVVPDEYLVKEVDVDFVMTFSINVKQCMKTVS